MEVIHGGYSTWRDPYGGVYRADVQPRHTRWLTWYPWARLVVLYLT